MRCRAAAALAALLLAAAALALAAATHQPTWLPDPSELKTAPLAAVAAPAKRAKDCLVIQTETRFVPPRDSPARNKTSLSDHAWAVSSLLTQHWAMRHNRSTYLYWVVPPPSLPSSPVKNVLLSPYWSKVPALIYALRVARHNNIRVVLYVDTDAFPSPLDPPPPHNHSLDVVLALFDSDPNLHIAYGQDLDAWAVFLQDGNVFGGARNAINTGIIAMRVGDVAESVLRHAYFNLTQTDSPLELQFNETFVFVKRKTRLTTALSAEEVHALLATTFNETDFRSGLIWPGSARDTFFSIAPERWSGSGPRGVGSAGVATRCCDWRECEQLFGTKDVSCRWAPKFDGLRAWPGEQGRLAWAYATHVESHQPPQQRIIPAFARSCLANHRDVPGFVFSHYCGANGTPSNWKFLGGKFRAIELASRLGFANVGELDGRVVASKGKLKEVAAGAAAAAGWDLLEQTLRRVEIPPEASSMTVDEVLRTFFDPDSPTRLSLPPL